jgi:hypothetical protein
MAHLAVLIAERKVNQFLYEVMTPARGMDDLIVMDMWRKVARAYDKLTSCWHWRRLNFPEYKHAGVAVQAELLRTLEMQTEWLEWRELDVAYYEQCKRCGRVVNDDNDDDIKVVDYVDFMAGCFDGVEY